MNTAVQAARGISDELAVTVLLVHHTGWNNPTRERGSNALRGAVDTVVELHSGKHGLALRCVKQRNDAPFPDIPVVLWGVGSPLVFDLNDGQGAPESTRSTSRSGTTAHSDVAEKILEVLKEADHPLTQAEIVSGVGRNRQTVLQTLKDLVAEGRVVAEGVRPRLYSLPAPPTCTAT